MLASGDAVGDAGRVRLALFADGEVGARALRLVVDRGHPVACLVMTGALERAEDPVAMLAGNPLVQEVVLADDLDPETMRRREIDLGLLAWWPKIIGDDLIASARLGFLNIHPSLLPHQRGKDPNFWVIREGTPFGVTIHHVDPGVDTGDIAFQREIEVRWEDDGEVLYRRSTAAAVDLLDENLDRILLGDIPRRPQPPGVGSYHRRAELEEASRIPLDEPSTGRQLLNLLRARTFRGHPAAWFVDDGERYEVRIEIRRAGAPPGTRSANPAEEA